MGGRLVLVALRAWLVLSSLSQPQVQGARGGAHHGRAQVCGRGGACVRSARSRAGGGGWRESASRAFARESLTAVGRPSPASPLSRSSRCRPRRAPSSPTVRASVCARGARVLCCAARKLETQLSLLPFLPLKPTDGVGINPSQTAGVCACVCARSCIRVRFAAVALGHAPLTPVLRHTHPSLDKQATCSSSTARSCASSRATASAPPRCDLVAVKYKTKTLTPPRRCRSTPSPPCAPRGP